MKRYLLILCAYSTLNFIVVILAALISTVFTVFNFPTLYSVFMVISFYKFDDLVDFYKSIFEDIEQ